MLEQIQGKAFGQRLRTFIAETRPVISQQITAVLTIDCPILATSSLLVPATVTAQMFHALPLAPWVVPGLAYIVSFLQVSDFLRLADLPPVFVMLTDRHSRDVDTPERVCSRVCLNRLLALPLYCHRYPLRLPLRVFAFCASAKSQNPAFN